MRTAWDALLNDLNSRTSNDQCATFTFHIYVCNFLLIRKVAQSTLLHYH